MVSIMGPPPPDFLERSEKSQLFWDTAGDDRPSFRLLHILSVSLGNWKGVVPILETDLKTAEQRLHGEEKLLFLSFLRKMLQWKPEDRSDILDIFMDEWLLADLIESGDVVREP